MKTIKISSLVLLFFFVLGVAFTNTALAQQKATPEQRIHKRVQKLKTELTLSDDQATKIEAIYLDRENKIAAMGQDSTTDPKTFKKQRRTINKGAMDQVNMLLSEQQRQKWQAIRAQRKMPAKTEE